MRLVSGRLLPQGSIGEATSESEAEARRIKQQSKLDQTEIPEDQLSMTTEQLGKGGFGEVFLADYNGRNVAAKVRNELAVLNASLQGRKC